MQLILTIEKRHFYFLVVFIAVLFVVGVSASNWNLNGVGHDANETGPGTFGGTSADTFVFPGFVTAKEISATDAITLNGTRKTSWPSSLGISILPASNITNGTFGSLVGEGNFGFPGLILLPNNAPNNGIFWSNSRDVNKPHIDYSSSTGLWISGGKEYMTPVNFEGDINVKSQIVGYEYVLIEGDHKWGSFPDDSFDHACQCDMYGYLLECNQSGFPASSSDYGYCYDKYRSTGLEGQGDKYTNKFTKVAIVKGGHINASSLSAEQIEVNGTLTLGGVAREKWLQGSCPFGEFLTGIGVDGSFSCARASYSLQSIGNLDHWMDSSKYYTGNDVCLHAYKNCTSVQGEAYAPCYYGIRNRCTKSCTDSIPAAQWSTDGTASTTGPCAYYWGGCNIVAEWMASCI